MRLLTRLHTFLLLAYCDIFSNGRVFLKNLETVIKLNCLLYVNVSIIARNRLRCKGIPLYLLPFLLILNALLMKQIMVGIFLLEFVFCIFPERKNIADAYIRVYKEHHNVCKTDITPTAKAQSQKKLIQVIKRMGYSKEEAYAFFDSLGEIETEAQLTNALYRINELGKAKRFYMAARSEYLIHIKAQGLTANVVPANAKNVFFTHGSVYIYYSTVRQENPSICC